MDQPDNYYSVLGVTKATTDLDIRQAYNILVDSLRSKATPDTQALAKQRMQLLNDALHTLLNPEKKKRHDEKLDWFVAQSRAAAERDREAAIRLKQAQDAALEAQKAAMAAEQEAANAATRREAEAARRREELARVEAEAAARFRKLRKERMLFAATEIAPLHAEDETVTQAPEPVPLDVGSGADAGTYLRGLGQKALVGSVVFIVFFGLSYWMLRPNEPKPPALPPLAQQTAPATSPPAPVAVLPQPVAQTTTPKSPPKGPAKSASADSAKAAEPLLYQKVLQRVEEEHPELNPERAGHRADLQAYVASRMNAHVKEGYPRSKALDIAVRDLETQEQTKRMLEKFRSSQEKPQPEATPVLDKGAHQGFDPKCRWVTPEQWSCK